MTTNTEVKPTEKVNTQNSTEKPKVTDSVPVFKKISLADIPKHISYDPVYLGEMRGWEWTVGDKAEYKGGQPTGNKSPRAEITYTFERETSSGLNNFKIFQYQSLESYEDTPLPWFIKGKQYLIPIRPWIKGTGDFAKIEISIAQRKLPLEVI